MASVAGKVVRNPSLLRCVHWWVPACGEPLLLQLDGSLQGKGPRILTLSSVMSTTPLCPQLWGPQACRPAEQRADPRPSV
jgi:hypothetical protein